MPSAEIDSLGLNQLALVRLADVRFINKGSRGLTNSPGDGLGWLLVNNICDLFEGFLN